MSQSISLFDLIDYFSSYLNHISHIALQATVSMQHISSWEADSFSATRKFITVFTTVHHGSLPCNRLIQSMPLLTIYSIFNFILSSIYIQGCKLALSFIFPHQILVQGC